MSAVHKRHPTYYFENEGNVVFLVEKTLFKVHRYFLQRDSQVFHDMFSCPHEPGSEAEGLSDERPIHIPQIKSNDFEALLWVYYHFLVERTESTAERWASTLRLSHMYQMTSIKELAIAQLKRFDAPITFILIGRETETEELVQRGYVTVACRKLGLEPEEAEQMGLREVVNVMRFALWAHSLEPDEKLQAIDLDKPGVMDVRRFGTSLGYATSVRAMVHDCILLPAVEFSF
ncbi:hypothetical protein JAAARDRAFT_343722 [Jaapia argillacea MUCL 33604]|uniref:BTB domain-containing protein n=1 Tax=Jaapia argillacea MUCL 33604 TaxID=933084 RepID=A0A067PMZ9_9AGAM|nr:hypothetical protein JAAARDRAFT_343722 [Jaapia argillacea MUCL 33604]